jgi:IPT/TIG domain
MRGSGKRLRNRAGMIILLVAMIVPTVGVTPAFAVAPTVISFVPITGPVGTSVTIVGTGFTGATSVRFNGVSATFVAGSAVQITATVPTGATTGLVSVTNPDGSASSVAPFTVTGGAAPVVASFAPITGPVGTAVTILGTGFTGATSVRFNGVSATFDVGSAVQITATVPTGATTGLVSVTTPNGSASSAESFTVTGASAPVVFAMAPVVGPVGTQVILDGTRFTGATSVSFNGVRATFAVGSDETITTTVPDGASSGPVSVRTPDGLGVAPVDFSVASGTVDVHKRGLTLKLAKWPTMRGHLWTVDGWATCSAKVGVKMQRRMAHGWRTVGSMRTNKAGRFTKRITRPGTYRVVAPRVMKTGGANVCRRKVSRRIRNG